MLLKNTSFRLDLCFDWNQYKYSCYIKGLIFKEVQIEIVKLEDKYIDDLVLMLLSIWPDSNFEDEKEACIEVIENPNEAYFLAISGHNSIGFVYLNLRYDHVEGANSSPVAYVEGIFVKNEYQKKGTGSMLLDKAEEWALSKGCTQLGSDVEIDNLESLTFHQRMGFKVENKIICLMKNLL